MQNAIKLIRKPVLSLATTAGVLGVLIVVRALVDGYKHGAIFGDITGSQVGVLLVMVMIALAMGIMASDRECNSTFNKWMLSLVVLIALSAAICVPMVFSFIDFDAGVVYQEASRSIKWVVNAIPIP